jgi:hypothetical protein
LQFAVATRVLACTRHRNAEKVNTMSRRMTVAFLSATILVASAPGAFAQIWSAAGVTGTVDEADLHMHRFNSTGSVSIDPAVASGTLDIRFPVYDVPNLLIPQQGDCPEIRANLRDTGAGARVIVRLMALSIFPGSGTALTPLAEIDTNALSAAGAADEYRSYRTCISRTPPGSEFLFDKAFFNYYVEAQLIKTASTANPGLMSVQICPSQDACDP